MGLTENPARPGQTKDSIKVFLVDDHQVLLEGMAKLIQNHPAMDIVGTARDGREALKKIQVLRPDVVLMDISMPNLNGVEATRLISEVSPKTKVVILSMHENEEFLRRALKAGASGYLLKDSTANELFLAIEEAHQGNSYISPSLSRKLINEYLATTERNPAETLDRPLTGREREVLQLLSEGHSNQAIASSLHLSPTTVATHRKNIMKKLHLHRITELVRYAIRNGIIQS
jgi:two-component system, NarL family, response regulator NreC